MWHIQDKHESFDLTVQPNWEKNGKFLLKKKKKVNKKKWINKTQQPIQTQGNSETSWWMKTVKCWVTTKGSAPCGSPWASEGAASHQELKSDRGEASGDSMLPAPWNSLFGWLSVSISPRSHKMAFLTNLRRIFPTSRQIIVRFHRYCYANILKRTHQDCRFKRAGPTCPFWGFLEQRHDIGPRSCNHLSEKKCFDHPLYIRQATAFCH